MDQSRIKDLMMLKKVMQDPDRPLKGRKVAYISYNKIIKQIKDPKLSKLRERLVKATYAEDKREIWKISATIKDYLKEDKLEEGTN